MLIFPLLISLVSARFETLKQQDLKLSSNTTTKQELDCNKPFLVFLHFEREDFSCPLCAEYRDFLQGIRIPVRDLNFAENIELGSRFLQHTFPVFIVRYRNSSYVLEPQDGEDLLDIVNNERWKSLCPVRTIVDVNSFFAIAFSKVNRFIFYGIDFFYFAMKYVPDYAVNAFTMVIIAYLIYSVIDVLSTKDKKIKEE